MTTMAATVANVRRVLKDRPEIAQLDGALGDTTTESFNVSATDAVKFAAGNVWEHDDNTGERRYIKSVTGLVVVGTRGYDGSTADAHSDDTYLVKDPRFPYNEITQAVNTVLYIGLFNAGVYDVVNHQITVSADTIAYTAPTASCEEFLWVYQRINSIDSPTPIWDFTRLPRLVDTTLWANGRVFEISGGTAGTTYYVNCKHKLTLDRLSTAQEQVVLFLASAHLLEWEEPHRTSGPTNQGDRTVKPGQNAQMAAYYRAQAKELIAKERAYLRALNPPFRNYRRSRF